MATKKSTATEQFVDTYIEMNAGRPPTYQEIADKFNIKHTAAYNRCKSFRHKMTQHSIIETPIDKYIRKYKQVA